METRTRRARSLRRSMTEAERHLWRELRRKAAGVRFRRQVPIGPYVVDFACFHKRLVVEIDGGQHLGDPRDALRDEWLVQNGFRVLRFWNHEVLGNTDGVLTVILREVGWLPEDGSPKADDSAGSG